MTDFLMTQDDIHDFGVEIVYGWMKKEGYKILGVNTNIEMNPQIIAEKDGQLAHVGVRTTCFPNKGELESHEMAMSLIHHADENNATCYFASVGIANSESEDDAGMSIPQKGAGFFVAFEGLTILTTSDRIRLL